MGWSAVGWQRGCGFPSGSSQNTMGDPLVKSWKGFTLKPYQRENWVFWEWLNSPFKTKQAPQSLQPEQWILMVTGTRILCLGGQSWDYGNQTCVCPMPSHHPCLTFSAPPLLSFAVSQDLFSPIFLPTCPLHFPAPAGLGWLARAVEDPSW